MAPKNQKKMITKLTYSAQTVMAFFEGFDQKWFHIIARLVVGVGIIVT